MSTEQFDTILAQIQHLIYKPDSKWQCSISPEEKLAICIRYEILYLTTCFLTVPTSNKIQNKRYLRLHMQYFESSIKKNSYNILISN